MAKRPVKVSIGSPVPAGAEFEELKFTREMYDMAWDLVGPSIDRNSHHMTLDRLFCVAFIEGMRFGMEFNKTDQ